MMSSLQKRDIVEILTRLSKVNFDIPLRCKGIAVVLLKKFDDVYKVLLLKRATPVLRVVWCYIGGSIEEGETA
ncbi:NUDIX hydrolase [Lederbergia citri]|uniref:hypothetical protein n=1 Tax=Lederbergia citri TaxID=2833580 RepID=UPI001F3D4557|nr:hypothetical protein [Lederbergia citri]